MTETSVPDSVSAVHNITNRDVESEFEATQEGKIREIVMDNMESENLVCLNKWCFQLLVSHF